MSGRLSRRRLLAGTGVASAALLAGSGVAGVGVAIGAAAATPPGDDPGAVLAFRGPHQGGIATPPQKALVFAAFDVTTDRAGLAALLSQWTGAAERLTAGQPVEGPDGPFDPPPDTGEAVGLPPSRLTLTLGFGPPLFDGRFGLSRRRPAALVDLPAFAGDDLDPSLGGGDLCIQACADDPQVAFHAIHDLTRIALGSATIRYYQVGLARTASGGSAQPSPRNLLGFHDGTANINPDDRDVMDRFVWVDGSGDQRWMVGGTYLVVRRIRIHLEAWDRSTLADQERTIGRVKVSGAPLGSTRASEPVDLGAVGYGGQPTIPADAHIRMAAPATNGGQAILRRGYSFADGVDPTTGELDAGLYFLCFQKDPRLQFIPIQTRLAGNDALTPYLLHTGSGIFACPPGLAEGQTFGHGLV